MTMEDTGVVGERDLEAVEDRLAALYADLPAAQQAVLERIILAGVDALASADTSGYSELDTHYEAQRMALQRAWRTADQRGPHDRAAQLAEAAQTPRRRVFQPLAGFFRRAPAVPAPTSGSAPA